MPSRSSSVSRRALSAMIAAAASKRARSTIPSNAPSARTHFSAVPLALLLQLERHAVPDVVADVLRIDQHLVDRPAGPGPAQVGRDAPSVQGLGDLALGLRVLDEGAVHPLYRRHLLGRPGGQHHPIGLDTLLLAPCEVALGQAALVDQASPEAVAGRTTLPEPVLDQAALTGEDLGRELPAVLRRHHPLHALDDGRQCAPVVLERLSAVADLDAGAPTAILVVGALVGIREPAPPAHVVDEDRREVRRAALDVRDQPLERVAALDP